MDALTSMRQKLQPLGIYDLSVGSLTALELQVWAEELDLLYDELDALTRECMIPTAESYGLSERERFSGRENPEMTASQRREILLTRERGCVFDGTLEGFEQFVSSLGIQSFTVEEFEEKSRINLTVADDLSLGEKTLFEKRVRSAFPINANLVLSYAE